MRSSSTILKICSVLFVFLLFSQQKSHAQLTVADTIPTINQLQTLFGAGVTISNLTTTCDTVVAVGEFDASISNLGLDRGVILSTGNINDAPGPNTNGGTSTSLGTPGDVDLDALVPGFTTFDACVIEFDIVPLCDTIAIQYVFASEEYPEFVFSSFNDVFAFFISGPGITGTQNIALVPGTAIPVAIDNVNATTNSQYYVDNTGGATVEFDGFTVPLVAQSEVIPCMTYHIKIAIADAGDQIYDSAVFLEAGGIGCTSQILSISSGNSLNFGGNVAVEGCVDGFFQFNIPLPSNIPDTFHFSIGGTATPNVDYIPFPDSVIIPPGQTSVTIPVTILNDQIVEGQETIQLIYVDSLLCTSQLITDTISLLINDPPNSYAGPDVLACSGDSVQIGVPNVSGFTYNWTPSVGINNSTVSNPNISLVNNTGMPDTFEYVLTTIALLGNCESKDTIQVVVDGVKAYFVADTVCEGVPTTFNNFSLGITALTYEWEYGDGSISSGFDNPHLYANDGVFPAQLIATTALGCKDTFQQNVWVQDLPVVAFTAPATCQADSVTFIDNTNIGTAWSWDFGDGNSSTSQDPTHFYQVPGNYSVQLTVTTNDGCVDSASQSIDIFPMPTAIFNADSVCEGLSTQFSANCIVPGGFVANYLWDFGDGNTATGVDPSHTYTSDGTYVTLLLITDNNGCMADTFVSVVVHPSVDADFQVAPVCFGDSSEFVDISLFSTNGTLQSWMWTFGDGGNASDQNPIYYYNGYGNYQVQLSIESIHGCTDEITKQIDVYDQPIADFSFNSVCDGFALPFLDQSQFSNQNVSWNWDFGDNTSSLTQDPDHVFPANGTFSVTLVIANNNGCADTVSQPVEVYPVPVANFSAPDICDQAQAQFNDFTTIQSPGVLQRWNWDFGDGKTAFQPSPQHLYSSHGIYSVALKVESQHGCRDSVTQSISVFPNPVASWNTVSVCEGDTNVFTDRSFLPISQTADTINAWVWDFDDNSGSTQMSPVHLYSQAGFYQANLTLTTNNGCIGSHEREVEVYELPDSPTILDDTVCFGKGAYLLASSPNEEVVKWFEHPTIGLPFREGYSYATPPLPYTTTYYVEAIHRTRECRSGRFPVTAHVFDELIASMDVSSSNVELPNAVVNFSVNANAPIASYQWTFDDGGSSTDSDPAYTFAEPDKYKVVVDLIDVYGCEIQLSEVIEVREVIGLHIPSAFSPDGDGVNDEYYIGANLIERIDFQVFNRWGNLVFNANIPSFRWDGTSLKGIPLPEGVYMYKMNATTHRGKEIQESGSITLIR